MKKFLSNTVFYKKKEIKEVFEPYTYTKIIDRKSKVAEPYLIFFEYNKAYLSR